MAIVDLEAKSDNQGGEMDRDDVEEVLQELRDRLQEYENGHLQVAHRDPEGDPDEREDVTDEHADYLRGP